MEPNVKRYGGMAVAAGGHYDKPLAVPAGRSSDDVAGAGCGSNACTHVYDVFSRSTENLMFSR